MAIDYQALKDELTAGHPVTGPYNADDALAAGELNALNRDGPADPLALLQYLTLERFRTGTLYGRLKMVSEARVLRAGNSWEFQPVPMGVSDAQLVPTHDQVAAASSLLRYVDTDTAEAVNMLDARLDNILNDLASGGIQAIGPADKTAIQALSQGVQSRASELGFGRVRTGDVITARSLP